MSSIVCTWLFYSKHLVKIVCPKEPGKPGEMITQVEAAFKELEGLKIKTLVFVFSGHHEHDQYFLGGPKESILHSELQYKLQHITTSLEKIIIIMDCCHAMEFFLSNGGNKKKLQLNACDDEEETVLEPEGSIFLNSIKHCLTGEALGIQCSKGKQHDCSIPGDFVTIEYLHKYVENHNKENINPNYSISGGDCSKAIIAYNYKFDVQLKFSFTDHKQSATILYRPHQYEDIGTLHALLFEQYIGKFSLLSAFLV